MATAESSFTLPLWAVWRSISGHTPRGWASILAFHDRSDAEIPSSDAVEKCGGLHRAGIVKFRICASLDSQQFTAWLAAFAHALCPWRLALVAFCVLWDNSTFITSHMRTRATPAAGFYSWPEGVDTIPAWPCAVLGICISAPAHYRPGGVGSRRTLVHGAPRFVDRALDDGDLSPSAEMTGGLGRLIGSLWPWV